MSETTVKGAQIGVVQTDARDKTRKVVIEYRAHNGDIVEIVQCRPISKTKAWKISRIVEKRGG